MSELCYLTIIVSDLERSVDFYKALGFEKVQVGDSTEAIGITYLRNGNLLLELIGDKDAPVAKPTDDHPVLGIHDFSLSVDSAEDTLHDLIRKGIASEDTEIMEPGDGLRFFKLADPDSVLIGVMEDKRNFTKIP